MQIRFRTPVCQMNENRPISAESQHNFHFLPHFNSKTTEPIFTIFSHDVAQLVERVFARRYAIPFRNDRAISAVGKRRTYRSSAIQYLPYGAKIVKIGPADPEILGSERTSPVQN